jgi:hypothetical protein
MEPGALRPISRSRARAARPDGPPPTTAQAVVVVTGRVKRLTLTQATARRAPRGGRGRRPRQPTGGGRGHAPAGCAGRSRGRRGRGGVGCVGRAGSPPPGASMPYQPILWHPPTWASPLLVVRHVHVRSHEAKGTLKSAELKMSHDRTRFVTLRLDAPPTRSCGAAAAGEDDLAAVLRWLGEASAAGWRVTAHIPQARMALVVATDDNGGSVGDDDTEENLAAAMSQDSIIEADEDDGDDDTDASSDSEDDVADDAPLSPAVVASRRQPQVRFASQPAPPPPRLRSPTRRIVGVARRQ